MQTTVRGTLPELTAEQKKTIGSLMRVQSSAKRFAYNRYREEELTDNDLKKLLMARYDVNARNAWAAMTDARATIESQRELLRQNLSDVEWRLKKAEKKLPRVRDPLKKKGVRKRTHKLKKQRDYYRSHLKAGTVLPAVFGGKKNFKKRKAGEITNEEWKELRDNNYCSIGSENDGGNQNLRILPGGEGEGEGATPFRLRINTGPRKHVFVGLWVPERNRREISGLFESGKAYLVRLMQRKDVIHAHVSFYAAKGEAEPAPDFSSGSAGIDINTDRLAVTLVHPDGNFICSKVFRLTHADSLRTHAKEHLLGNKVKETIEYVKSKGISVVAVEDLKFPKRYDTNSKKLNRTLSSFVHRKTRDLLTSRCCREEMSLVEVNPNYTSFIGKHKYAETYGLSVHQAAALVIARRAAGLGEKFPKPARECFQQHVKVPGRNPGGTEGLWKALYGLEKRRSNRARKKALPDGTLRGSLRETANSFGVQASSLQLMLELGVRIPGPPATTVKPGSLRGAGTKSLRGMTAETNG